MKAIQTITWIFILLISFIALGQRPEVVQSRAIIQDLNTKIQVLIDDDQIKEGLSLLKAQKAACDNLAEDRLCQVSLAFTSGYFYQQAALKDSINKSRFENQAVKYYKIVLKEYPDNKVVLSNLIELSKDSQGDKRSINRSTIKRLEGLAEENPFERANYLIDIGNLYKNEDNISMACDYYRRAYDYDPFSKRACTSMADLYISKDFKCTLSANIRQFAQDCQQIDLANNSAKLLQKELSLAYEAKDYNKAIESLILWANVLADNRWLTPVLISRLHEELFPTDQPVEPAAYKINTAILELLEIFKLKSLEDLNAITLIFWNDVSPRINVSKTWSKISPIFVQTKILHAKGNNSYYLGEYKESEAFWNHVLDNSENQYPTLFTKSAINLSTLYKRQADEGATEDDKFNDLINRLFNQKAKAYSNGDASMIRKLHTTLGSIFYERINWDKEDVSNEDIYNLKNARFQLKHALSDDLGEIINPELRKMLAKVYKKLENDRMALESYTKAVKDHLSIDQINKAEQLNTQIHEHHATLIDEQSEKALDALKMIIAFRKASFNSNHLEFDNGNKIDAYLNFISEIEEEVKSDLGDEFVEAQFFRGLSDFASKLPQNNSIDRQIIYANALNRLNQISLLASLNDYDRITNITNALQKSVDQSNQLEVAQINKKVDLSYKKTERDYRTFNIPGYNKELEVPIKLFELAATVQDHYDTPNTLEVPKIKLKQGRFIKY